MRDRGGVGGGRGREEEGERSGRGRGSGKKEEYNNYCGMLVKETKYTEEGDLCSARTEKHGMTHYLSLSIHP